MSPVSHFGWVWAGLLLLILPWVVLFPEWFLCRVLPYRDITRDGELYLRRFYLTPRWWKKRLFLHHILRADPDPHMHDHPWGFRTYVIKGGYLENFYRPGVDGGPGMHGFSCLVGRHPEFGNKPGWKERPATYRHKIVQVFGSTWTLVVADQAEREWGFWVDGKFVPWFEYLSVPNEPMQEDVINAR